MPRKTGHYFFGKFKKNDLTLGAITPPKTPEQLQAENMQLMSEMLAQIKSMQAEMEILKNECKSTSTAAEHEPAEHAETVAGVGAGTKSVKRGK